MSRHRVHCVAVLLLSLTSLAAAVESDSLRDELARIFGPEKHYEPETFGPARWLLDGEAYTTLEPSESVPDAKDIVRYESGSGKREVLVEAKSLVPPGETKPLEIKDYAWSLDRARLLVFTNTKRVWRRDTRGDYWVFDRESRTLRKLGGVAPAATLMFAKFSPDGTRVAYVHENDIYVEALATGAVTRLTQDGSATSIHGTSDWVYEEELDVRDGFRWSPDGRRIVYWSFDSTGVGEFTLINDTDSLYPTLTRVPYPKVGTTNSAVRIGVVSSNGGETSWMKVPGDPRDTYVARVDWTKDGDHLVLQHLNRLQNTNDLLRADATSGEVERLFRDQSDTWVEVVDELTSLKTTGEYLWLSERDGFRHAYRVGGTDGEPRLVTRFDADVIRPLGVDPEERWFYFTASPDDATQEYLYRASLDGSKAPKRLTPRSQPGTHGYDLSPDLYSLIARYLIENLSEIE